MANEKFESILKQIDQKIKKVTDMKQYLPEVAEKVTSVIYLRVKAGGGVSDANSNSPGPVKLAKLSKSYIEYRKGNVRFYTKQGKNGPFVYPVRGKFPSPVTGKFGSPSLSNLTLTGQMLEALTSTVLSNSIKYYIRNTTRKDGHTNAEIARYVSEKRPFLAMTEGEKNIIRTFTRQLIQEKIDKL